MTLAPNLSAAEAHSPSARTSVFSRLARDPVALGSVIVLAVIVLTGALTALISPADPNAGSIKDLLAPPSASHLLGTDGAGRDVLSRLLHGTRFTLAGAGLATAVSIVIGVSSGLVAGYFKGWFDALSNWSASLIMALPGIVVLLAARAVVGPSMWISMTVCGLLISPGFHRLVYSAVNAVRNELYVDAARVSGLNDWRIIWKHVLTVVRAPVIIMAAGVTAMAIGIQGGLEFLGLGDLSLPTWGSILGDAFQNIYSAPLLMLWPSLAFAVTSIAFALLANSMRDVLEGTRSTRRTRGKRDSAVRPPASDPSQKAESIIVVHPEDAETGAVREKLLCIDGLKVGYDQKEGTSKTVVHDVTLTVLRGQIHGLIGESGSGKTQTAWSVLGLLPEGGTVTGGSILFEGTELTTLPARELSRLRGRRIAYIPQEPMSNLDPSFTIGSQLVEPMRFCLGLSKAEAKARALELLAHVGIPSPERTFNAYPHEVSGGMAQRVLIAGAVSCKPDLLIADEPTTALDVTVQAEVLDLIRDLRDELDMGVVLVTHNFGVVADLCDHVTIMRNGTVVETGPVRSVFVSPQHPYTKKLFGAILDESTARGPLTPDSEAAVSLTDGAAQ
ncbi:dipeptide/oligopeptide/nickel ABC transporter permease/ATP-binding protein [Arthrobacter sp. KNU40]|uniref:dipeptide/oligopeptide/nickel ABC transporter permease/ATP-binding protein n=1 Tax=Arthrobacter sp. KNU40 TaxID=3447965 RepID=UPI003F609266